MFSGGCCVARYANWSSGVRDIIIIDDNISRGEGKKDT